MKFFILILTIIFLTKNGISENIFDTKEQILKFNSDNINITKNQYIDNIKRKYIHSIVSFRSWNYEFLIFITRYGWLWDKKINNKSFYGNNLGKINYLYYLIRVLLRNWVDIVMVIIIRI